MAFMKPVVDRMKMYHVETNCGTECIPHDLIGNVATENPEIEDFKDYIEGNEIFEVELKEGWYSRLSADGYLDASEWSGPFDSEEEALEEIMDVYECNEDGDEISQEDNS